MYFTLDTYSDDIALSVPNVFTQLIKLVAVVYMEIELKVERAFLYYSVLCTLVLGILLLCWPLSSQYNIYIHLHAAPSSNNTHKWLVSKLLSRNWKLVWMYLSYYNINLIAYSKYTNLVENTTNMSIDKCPSSATIKSEQFKRKWYFHFRYWAEWWVYWFYKDMLFFFLFLSSTAMKMFRFSSTASFIVEKWLCWYFWSQKQKFQIPSFQCVTKNKQKITEKTEIFTQNRF